MAPSFSSTGFAESLRVSGQSTIDVGRFRKRFGLSPAALAKYARVHQSVLSDASSNENLQQFMRDSLQVASAAVAINGDEDCAVEWMRNTPIPEFGDQLAIDLVSNGKTESVLMYLSSIESGFSG